MYDPELLVTASRAGYTALDALYTGLDDDQWAVQSLCPEWTARGVLVHRIGVEHILTGWSPSLDAPPPFERLGPFEAELSEASNADVLARARDVWAARSADLDAVDAEMVAAPSITPTGPGAYGDFLRIRVFDSWVHERDVTIPLGVATDDGGPRAAYAVDEVTTAMGYIVGKKIGLTDGLGITFHVTGGVERDIHVLVDGRAGVVDELADPVVEVTADVATFVMLAAGRVDPHERIDTGAVTWTGDDSWGEKAARNLAYTR